VPNPIVITNNIIKISALEEVNHEGIFCLPMDRNSA